MNGSRSGDGQYRATPASSLGRTWRTLRGGSLLSRIMSRSFNPGFRRDDSMPFRRYRSSDGTQVQGPCRWPARACSRLETEEAVRTAVGITEREQSPPARWIAGRSKPLAWIGVVVALGFPCLPITRWVNEFGGIRNLVGYELIWWAVIGSLLAYVRFAEHEPLSSLGFRAMTRTDVVVAIGAAVAIVGGLAAIYFAIFPWARIQNDRINVLFATPLWWRIISVVRAGVGEEVLFRGYAIERLGRLTGRRG